jgi:hypothetical protein
MQDAGWLPALQTITKIKEKECGIYGKTKKRVQRTDG